MPVYETLTTEADAGGSQSVEPKVSSTMFQDKYEQISTYGNHNPTRKMNLTFTCDGAEADALIAFFDRHRGVKPFWFSFDKVEPLRLMQTDGAYSKNHVGGLKYTVTVTLKNFGGLNVS